MYEEISTDLSAKHTALLSSASLRGSRTSFRTPLSTGRCWRKVFYISNHCSFVPYLTILGWRFAKPDEKVPGENVTPDPIHPHFTHLRDIYFEVNAEYEGRFTVPTLYDVKQNKIVSNEVIRPLNASSSLTPSSNQAGLIHSPHHSPAKSSACSTPNLTTYSPMNTRK